MFLSKTLKQLTKKSKKTYNPTLRGKFIFFKQNQINLILKKYIKFGNYLIQNIPLPMDNLQYTIEDQKSYGESIMNITMKRIQKYWLSQCAETRIVIRGKFKESCYVNKLQVRGYQTEHLEILFKDMDNETVGSISMLLDGDRSIPKNVDTSGRVATFQAILTTKKDVPKNMGLNFLFFKGQKNPMRPTKEKISNLSKEQVIKYDSITAPQKSKPAQTSKPYANLLERRPDTSLFNDRQKRNVPKKNYDQRPKQEIKDDNDEFKRALKQSEKTFQQEKLKNSRKEHTTNDQFQLDIDSETLPIENQRNYPTAPLGQLLQCYKYVNSRWLEAQRQAQIKAGIRQEDRLSNFIHVRHLHNKNIFIDNCFTGAKRSKLQSLAEKLGAILLKAPKNNCILISNSLQNTSVKQILKKFNQIKAVNEDYLQDCKKMEASLNWKDYALRN